MLPKHTFQQHITHQIVSKQHYDTNSHCSTCKTMKKCTQNHSTNQQQNYGDSYEQNSSLAC